MSHACKSILKDIFNLFSLFFFIYIYIVTNKSQKFFYINIFILGRSGVKSLDY